MKNRSITSCYEASIAQEAPPPLTDISQNNVLKHKATLNNPAWTVSLNSYSLFKIYQFNVYSQGFLI